MAFPPPNIAAPAPNPVPGVYLEPFGQEPALFEIQEGWETIAPTNLPPGFRPLVQPIHPTNQPGQPYGVDRQGRPLQGPISYLDNYPNTYDRPPIDIDREWLEDTPKLNALGFQFSAMIGSGKYGEVWRVSHRDTVTGHVRQLAAKIISAKTLFFAELPLKDIIKAMLHEVTVLRGLKHPAVVSIESVAHIRDDSSGFPSLFVFIFMESCEGCLTQLTKDSLLGYLGEHQAQDWFQQISDGLRYLHRNKIVHQDIKPNNILYKWTIGPNKIQYKLSDFATSKLFPPKHPMWSKTYPAGTSFYRPPETRHLGNTWGSDPSYVNLKAMDVYALAVSLAESLIGYKDSHWWSTKWFSMTPGLDFKSWINNSLIRSGRYPADHPVIDLMSRMTVSLGSKRLTMNQVLRHPWVTHPIVPH